MLDAGVIGAGRAEMVAVEVRQVVVVVFGKLDEVPAGEVSAAPGARTLSGPWRLWRRPVSPLQYPTRQSVLARRLAPPVIRALARPRRPLDPVGPGELRAGAHGVGPGAVGMNANLHRTATVRGRELSDQDMLGALDAARETRPGGLQAGDVPLHDLRYTLCVHSL